MEKIASYAESSYDELAHKLMRGMRDNGLTEGFALQILSQIKGFAE